MISEQLRGHVLCQHVQFTYRRNRFLLFLEVVVMSENLELSEVVYVQPFAKVSTNQKQDHVTPGTKPHGHRASLILTLGPHS